MQGVLYIPNIVLVVWSNLKKKDNFFSDAFSVMCQCFVSIHLQNYRFRILNGFILKLPVPTWVVKAWSWTHLTYSSQSLETGRDWYTGNGSEHVFNYLGNGLYSGVVFVFPEFGWRNDPFSFISQKLVWYMTLHIRKHLQPEWKETLWVKTCHDWELLDKDDS